MHDDYLEKLRGASAPPKPHKEGDSAEMLTLLSRAVITVDAELKCEGENCYNTTVSGQGPSEPAALADLKNDVNESRNQQNQETGLQSPGWRIHNGKVLCPDCEE